MQLFLLFLPCLLPMTGIQPFFHKYGISTHTETKDEKYDCAEQVAGKRLNRGGPLCIRMREVDHSQKIQKANDRHQSGIFEQTDKCVDDSRDDDFQRLRQNDHSHGLRKVQPRAAAPSNWPLGMACNPPRTTSAI